MLKISEINKTEENAALSSNKEKSRRDAMTDQAIASLHTIFVIIYLQVSPWREKNYPLPALFLIYRLIEPTTQNFGNGGSCMQT